MQAGLLNFVGLTYVGAEMSVVPFLEEKFSPKRAGPLLCLRRCSCEASPKSLPWNDLTYTNITGKKKTFNSGFPVMLRALGLSFMTDAPFLLTMDKNTKVTFWNQHCNRLPFVFPWIPNGWQKPRSCLKKQRLLVCYYLVGANSSLFMSWK